MVADLTDDKSTLVQVMAWCRQATSHYLNQCWPSFLSPYGVTRPQWVNLSWPRPAECHMAQNNLVNIGLGNVLLTAWWHQAFIRNNFRLSSMRFRAFTWSEFTEMQEISTIIIIIFLSAKLKLYPYLPRTIECNVNDCDIHMKVILQDMFKMLLYKMLLKICTSKKIYTLKITVSEWLSLMAFWGQQTSRSM